ncbi:hypothetical protein B0O95_1172 [Mycetohabitans endofungorum]|uniref:Uncharacterized protein n=1 Tax=Mycetohabitans endofungorum TaxID=417203 RepID=A0A2P5K755_9BURK|nr:hypothetical protein B0O95_1172 [Mycetohabitans endofungorum]
MALWLGLQRRFIYVQGCVAPDFERTRFLSALRETANVENVIDQTMTGPGRTLPYPLWQLPSPATSSQAMPVQARPPRTTSTHDAPAHSTRGPRRDAALLNSKSIHP